MPPHHPLSPRAQVTVNGWAGILIIVLLVAAFLFVILTTLLICKRKRARRQREREMVEEQSRPFVARAYDGGAHNINTPLYNSNGNAAQEHRYYVPENHGVELESNAPKPIELQGGMAGATNATRAPQQIERFEAPATGAHDVSPVEMPAHAVMR
jgi:hypothetical protein